MKRYEPAMANDFMIEFPKGRYCLVADYQDLEQKYRDLLMVMEEQYIHRPDPEEARKAVDELIEAVREQARAWLVEHPDSECHAKNSARVAAARAEIVEEE